MRPPGGPTTRGADLPTSTVVAENVGKQVLAELRGSLRELTKLLEPHGSQLRPWALPEASSAGLPVSPGRCR